MDKYNIKKTILLFQIIISTTFLALCTYYIFPEYDGNREMIGFYYAITTVSSFFVCIFVEFVIMAIYCFFENRAKKKAIESESSDEHIEYKKKLEAEQRNRYITGYKERYDKNN